MTTTTAGDLNYTNIGQQMSVDLYTLIDNGVHEPTGEKHTGTIYAIEHTPHDTTITTALWYNLRARRYTVVHVPHDAPVTIPCLQD